MTRAATRCMELEAEIALGIADGEERARALKTRPAVLAVAADWLSSRSWRTSCCSAPVVEPPAGLSPTSSSGCAASGARAGVGRCRARRERSPRSPRCSSPSRPRWPGGTSRERTSATMPPSTGTSYRRRTAGTSGHCPCASRAAAAGGLSGYAGSPSWMFVLVRGVEGSGRWRVELRTDRGARLGLGSFEVDSGRGGFGRALPVPLREVERVELSEASGPGRLTAVSRRR